VFEVSSLSVIESVRIIRLVMAIENPSPEVEKPIFALGARLESLKIVGSKSKDIL
jgi:hypothetical protein